MEYRCLGASGFTVPALSFGTGTFSGKGEFFQAWGSTDVAEARRLIDICLDHGITMFDTADIYSRGASESVLGEAIRVQPLDCFNHAVAAAIVASGLSEESAKTG